MEHVTRRRRLLVGVAGVLAVTAALTGCGSGGSAPQAPSLQAGRAAQPQLHGAVPDDHTPRPEFTLADTTGAAYDFGARTGGHVTLLYAGYTHCPDECPTAMADIAAALRKVSPDVASAVDVVFVTTDPWRDSTRVLRSWLDRFHPPAPYVGLTGTPTQVAGAEIAMGMAVAKREPAPKSYGSGRYSVSHFAAVMVFGRDDRLATLYPSGVVPADIAADLKLLVKE